MTAEARPDQYQNYIQEETELTQSSKEGMAFPGTESTKCPGLVLAPLVGHWYSWYLTLHKVNVVQPKQPQ